VRYTLRNSYIDQSQQTAISFVVFMTIAREDATKQYCEAEQVYIAMGNPSARFSAPFSSFIIELTGSNFH
jgi:hypothetical protein